MFIFYICLVQDNPFVMLFFILSERLSVLTVLLSVSVIVSYNVLCNV